MQPLVQGPELLHRPCEQSRNTFRKNLRADVFCQSDICSPPHSIDHLFDDEEVADAFREGVAACCDGRLWDPSENVATMPQRRRGGMAARRQLYLSAEVGDGAQSLPSAGIRSRTVAAADGS